MTSVQSRFASFAFVVGFLAAPAAAQTPDLSNLQIEDLMRVRVEPVFGASQHTQPVTEAPSAVTIVTAEDITRYGYRTLADILRSVRGLYVSYDRNYSYLGARGFAQAGDYNTRILLLVDGHRVNDGVYDQAGIGPELGLDVATFDRVEIIRGPSSALYGTNAFLAVVNVTTRTGRTSAGLAGSVEVGNLGQRRVSARYGRAWTNGADVLISGYGEAMTGDDALYFPEFEDVNDGVAEDSDEEGARGVSGRLNVGRLAISAAYGWRRKVVPTAAFDARFNDPSFETIDTRAFVDAVYAARWRGSDVSIRGSGDVYRYDAEYPYDSLDESSTVIRSEDYGHASWWTSDVRLQRTMGRHVLTAGAELRAYVRQDQGSRYDDNRIPAFATDVSTHVFGAYVQDEIRLRPHWIVGGGGRYDRYAQFDRLSPRANVIYTPAETRAVKYLFGTSFRAPNAYELDYYTEGVRDTSLRAETISTHEVVWEEYVGEKLRTSVAAYWNDADRLITLVEDEDGVLTEVNAGRFRARGLEVESEIRLPSGLEAVASYALQYSRDRDTDMELTNSPRHLAALRVSGRGPVPGATLALDLHAMSRRLTLSGGETGAHAVANVTYRHPLSAVATITASARNLFDTPFADPASAEHRQDAIPQQGMTFRIGLDWSWKPGQRAEGTGQR